MSASKKEDVFGLNGTFGKTQEKFQALGKAQSEFFAEALTKGMEFHKQQYDLVSRIVQNQIAHNSTLLQGYMNVVNNNIETPRSAEQKK